MLQDFFKRLAHELDGDVEVSAWVEAADTDAMRVHVTRHTEDEIRAYAAQVRMDLAVRNMNSADPLLVAMGFAAYHEIMAERHADRGFPPAPGSRPCKPPPHSLRGAK